MSDKQSEQALRAELYQRARLNAKRTEGGCLFFHGSTDKKGNARFKYKKKLYVPHRVVFEYLIGRKLGRAEDVRQTCGHRQCIEGDHLRLQSRQQTVFEAVERGTIVPPTVEPTAVRRKNRERVGQYDVDERARRKRARELRDERDDRIEALRDEYRKRIRKVMRGLFDRDG